MAGGPAVPTGAALHDDLLDRANTGGVRAQPALAYACRDGTGVPRDYAEAMRWGRRAADRGDPAATDFVGWTFFDGLGVRRNPVVAGYFRAAAGGPW